MRAMATYTLAAALAFAATAIAADEPAVEAPASAPTTQSLQIGGLPAAQWSSDEPVSTEDLQGRLWVLGVLEPWSPRSFQAASMLTNVDKTWSARGVPSYLVTAAPRDQVPLETLTDKGIDLPIGMDSPLSLLLPLDPLPKVYLVGPQQTVVWSGPVWHLSEALPKYYAKLTDNGLSSERTNELTNRLNRATAGLEHKEYFLAVGLASLVAQATPPNHPLHQQAQDLLAGLSTIGAKTLNQAQQLISQKRISEGYDLLQMVAEQFYGTGPGKEAITAIKQLQANDQQCAEVARRQDEASAQQTLDLAQEAIMAHRYADSQRYYQLILDLYPKSQVARRARQGLSRLHSDKAPATQLAEQLVEPASPVLLNLAARYVQIGRLDQARRYYQQVLQQAAGTAYADQARQALKDLPKEDKAAK